MRTTDYNKQGGVMKKYKARVLGYEIETVEVQRETKNSVWINQEWQGKKYVSQARKVTDYECYFDTWQEAKQHLLNHLDGKVQRARAELERYKSKYGNVSGMKEPINQ